MKKTFFLFFMVVTAAIFGQNQKNEAITKVISTGTEIKLEALDGKAYIYDAKKTFSSFIDEDFKNWGLNCPGRASTETLFDVSEVVADGTFIQIFTDISGDLDKIVMTQAQIIRF